VRDLMVIERCTGQLCATLRRLLRGNAASAQVLPHAGQIRPTPAWSDLMPRRSGLSALYGLLLRVFALACFVIGVAFVAFGCVLENPPKQWVSGCAQSGNSAHCQCKRGPPLTALPRRALVGLGSFALATSAAGAFAPGFGPRLVVIYLGVSAVLTFLQVILVLGLFGAQQKVAASIAATDTSGRYSE